MVGSRERYEVCMEAAGIALAAGDRDDAERAYRGAIQAIEGSSDFYVELSETLARLGSLKQESGNYAEAEELFRKALDVGERAHGSHDVGLVPALTGLGAARIMQGSPDQAHPFLARALDLSERHLGEAHPDLVILLNDLTRLYLKQAAYEYAEPLLLRLLALKRGKGEDHPEVATVLASLASVRQALGRYDSAEQLWRRVLEIRERTLAPNHFSLATSLENLATTLVARGKSQEALQMYKRALSIRELTLGTDHGSLRGSRERIADLQLQDSEEFFDGAERVAPMAPLRLSSGDRYGIPASATVIAERPAANPTREAPVDAFTFEPFATQPSDSHSEPPRTRTAETATAGTEDPPYLRVLMEIKDELEQTDSLARTTEHKGLATRAGAALAATTSLLKNRRAVVILGVSVVTIPLVAMAMAGVARSDTVSQREPEYAVMPAAPLTDSLAIMNATLQGSTARPSVDYPKDSATTATKTSSSRTKVEESETPRSPDTVAVTVQLDADIAAPHRRQTRFRGRCDRTGSWDRRGHPAPVLNRFRKWRPAERVRSGERQRPPARSIDRRNADASVPRANAALQAWRGSRSAIPDRYHGAPGDEHLLGRKFSRRRPDGGGAARDSIHALRAGAHTRPGVQGHRGRDGNRLPILPG